jgi:hypothetical protein
MTDATDETLRATGFHEAGRVVVARFFGLTVGKIQIGENESGHSEIGSDEHLPLIDRIALCVAGIEAQALFNCPTQEHAAVTDYIKVRELVQELTEAESLERRHAGYLRALEILKKRVTEVERLANELIERRCIDVN